MFEQSEKEAVPVRVLGVYEWRMKRAKEQKCLHAILKSNLLKKLKKNDYFLLHKKMIYEFLILK